MGVEMQIVTAKIEPEIETAALTDYLEAQRIARGLTMMIPERRHLLAMMDRIKELTDLNNELSIPF
jgi:hypothetical protein